MNETDLSPTMQYLADLNEMSVDDGMADVSGKPTDFLATTVASKCDPETITSYPRAIAFILNALALRALNV